MTYAISIYRNFVSPTLLSDASTLVKQRQRTAVIPRAVVVIGAAAIVAACAATEPDTPSRAADFCAIRGVIRAVSGGTQDQSASCAYPKSCNDGRDYTGGT